MPYIVDSMTHATVSRSQNLRGIIRHAGKHGVNVITIKPYTPEETKAGGFKVTFYFYQHGGISEHAITHFADWRALVTQNLLRGRNLRPERLTVTQAIADEMRANGMHAAIWKTGTIITVKD